MEGTASVPSHVTNPELVTTASPPPEGTSTQPPRLPRHLGDTAAGVNAAAEPGASGLRDPATQGPRLLCSD